MSTHVAPLDGVTVLDLTHVLAGPYCTYQLALLGADVVKVESLRGDMVRGWGGTEEQVGLGLGTGFVAQNAAKRSLAVDLETADGAEVVARLAAQADIVVENYRPSTIEGFGLGYEAVRSANPSVIYCSISAFGRTGPHGDRPGFDDVVQATSGYMSVNVRGDGPIRTGGPVLDYATGMQAASAVLGAVIERGRSGSGHHIDIAMQDVAMLLVNRTAHIAATTGVDPAPAGNRDGLLLGRYESADGYVMLAGYLPRHWRAICRVVGLDEYAELSGRELVARSDEVDDAVASALSSRTSAEWDDRFHAAGVVGGGVRTLAEVIATGQPDARELFSDVDARFGPTRVTNAGYLVDGEPLVPAFGPPMLGEHSQDVLASLGYSAAEIDTLVAGGVIGSPRA